MRIRPPELETSICDVKYHVSLCSAAPPPKPHAAAAGLHAPPSTAVVRRPVIGLVSITATRSFSPCQNPSDLLVQTDEGSLFPVVDLIRRIYRRLQFKSQMSLRILVGARRLDASKISILKSNKKKYFSGAAGRSRVRRPNIRVGPRMAVPIGQPLPTVHAHWLRDGWGSRRAAVRHEWRAVIITAAHAVARQGWNVRPCAARYMMAAAAAVQPPSGELPGSDATANFLLVDWTVKMRTRPPELETSICDVKYHVSLCSAAPPPKPHAVAAGLHAPPSAAVVRRPVIGLVSITSTRSLRPCQNPSDLLVQTDGGSLFPVVDLIRRIYRRLQFKSQNSLRILVGARRLDASKGDVCSRKERSVVGSASSGKTLVNSPVAIAVVCVACFQRLAVATRFDDVS
ncbi:hypothetical protein F511_16613 [Dorcoceras hygrometricum]|uniref:Uncharacterized protein n=1 Tax=Dorcoceras hygrometricum TaxID=472368 RepID=A0A2Z7CYE2_9LAMI|nr:hypothetical protein F511_16613 [Dorcoceras hygrometricum]